MKDKKFFRTRISIEILSDEEYNPETLYQIADDIINGHYSGQWDIIEQNQLSVDEMGHSLMSQATDPSFFHLYQDKGGNWFFDPDREMYYDEESDDEDS